MCIAGSTYETSLDVNETSEAPLFSKTYHGNDSFLVFRSKHVEVASAR